MATELQLALMAGGAYESTRKEINRFPIPTGWDSVNHKTQDSGFEAVTYIKEGTTLQDSTEIVISYAGTYDKDVSGDIAADANLAQGVFTNQLLQAARYYLDVQAANPGATITLTGHSLGGGLASLVAVFFNKDAVTFDQGPFANSARSFNGHDAAATLLDQLKSLSDPNNKPYDLSGLASFIEQRQTSGSSIPILDDGLMTLHVAKMALHAANYSAWKVTA
ncbi:MAG: Mbeg1-like protein [Rhodoferax sp.]